MMKLLEATIDKLAEVGAFLNKVAVRVERVEKRLAKIEETLGLRD